MHVHSEKILDSLLKNTLKRPIPYLIGGTITGTFIAYYYGFLFSIIVNTIIWFVISTTVNKYYWHTLVLELRGVLFLSTSYIEKIQKLNQ